jgi:cytochrome c-type biogenesis protein CcmH/NrfG
MTDPVKIEIVNPIITNTDNPWRTQGDYRQDQKRQFHLYVMQAITLLVAVAGLIASSWFQYQASKQPPQTVEVQCIEQQQSQHPSVIGNANSQPQTRKGISPPLPQQ